MQKYGLSERRVCKVLELNRSTLRYIKKLKPDYAKIKERIISLACKYGYYGYKKITDLLVIEGFKISRKQVAKIWREEGLKVPKKQPKRGRLYLNDGSCIRLRSAWINHVWSYDFVEDRLYNGRKIKFLTIIDEYSRRSLKIKAGYNLKSADVLESLSELFVREGLPDFIRSDNGSEFIEKNLREWLEELNVKTAYITPGSPWENGYCERFNGIFRHELLNREVFYTLEEARILAENWRREYNEIRPHESLKGKPPAIGVIVAKNMVKCEAKLLI